MSNEENFNNEIILTLVLPVYNEGDAVIPVISTLFLTVHFPFKILVVYDSPDDITIPTIRKLQEHFHDLYLVQNEWKRGVLNAIKTGFKNADTKYVGIWLSYHLDPFGILNNMIEKLESGYDLVSANRFGVDKRIVRGHKIKKLLSFLGNIILNRIIEMPISDVTTSLKLYRKTKLDSINIETHSTGGWAINTELAIKAAIRGYRLAEIPLESRNINLIHGLSKFKILKQLPEYFRWLYMGWQNRTIIKSHLTM